MEHKEVKIIQIQSFFRLNTEKEIDGLGDDGNIYWFDFQTGEWKAYN